MPALSELKNLSSRDRKMIQDAEAMLGPEPSQLGFMKNLFWGRSRNDLVMPYPEQSDDEARRCDELLEKLDAYLREEHPAQWIDEHQEIPAWALDRLFEIGVMGMTVSPEYGGLGLGITSYNRVLERIGRTCGSTAVVVSAHQSIGCKAIMLFGTEAQKQTWLPKVAREYLSAFCLSEPNVGCDAAGQETTCRLSEDGSHYVLNGEKKWITSGALSGVFTVIARQEIRDPRTGAARRGFTALLCTPDTPGVDIYEKNRSKSGIRGTWQARIRFSEVRVPAEQRLGAEGRGLHIALTCLNYGRCTLSAGMLGAAKKSMEQGIKWSRTRYQFGRPLSEFELVREKVARMVGLTYAMEAVLYLTTGMLDRGDEDVMVETAAAKVFCSEMGWQVVNDALQIMGGEGYMTENEVERAMRDSRINLIVEGANEVMQSFIFAYGGKQLAEQMIAVKEALLWDVDQGAAENVVRMARNALRPATLKTALSLGAELFLGLKPPAPAPPKVDERFRDEAAAYARLVRAHAHAFKRASMRHMERIVSRQVVQARLADNAVYLFAVAATLARITGQIRSAERGPQFERDVAAARHFCSMAEVAVENNLRALRFNADATIDPAARAAFRYSDALPDAQFFLPESSPVASGPGRTPNREDIQQFPGEPVSGPRGDGRQGPPVSPPSPASA